VGAAISSRAQAAGALRQAEPKPDGPSKQIFVLKKQDFIDRTGAGVGRKRPNIANCNRNPARCSPVRSSGAANARWDGASCFRAQARRSHFRCQLNRSEYQTKCLYLTIPICNGNPSPPRHLTATWNWSLSTVKACTLFHSDVAAQPKAGSAPNPERRSTTCGQRTGGNGRRTGHRRLKGRAFQQHPLSLRAQPTRRLPRAFSSSTRCGPGRSS
jgi:hypothetical protein